MQAGRYLHQAFIKHIPPLIVGQLMQDNIRKSLFRNIRIGQHDTWMEKANQQRGRNQRIDTQLCRPFDTCLLRSDGKPIQDLNVRNRGQSSLDIPHKALIDRCLSYQQSQRDHKPNQPNLICQQCPNLLKRMGSCQIFCRTVHISIALLRSDNRCGISSWSGQRGLLLRRQRGGPGNGLIDSLIGLSQQAYFRPKREQQPQNDHQPNVILPLTADFIFQKSLSQKQRQNKQTAGKGHGQEDFQNCVHCFSFPFSSIPFNSLYSSSVSRSPIIRLETSPFALPS